MPQGAVPKAPQGTALRHSLRGLLRVAR
jgi:hypothetical protein